MSLVDVYIGISGGIDSTATVAIMRSRGFNVVGVYLWMYGDTISKKVEHSLSLIKEHLGIEIVTYDVREAFKRDIITPYLEGCLSGRTLSPCVMCNTTIKWRYLIEVADSRGGGMIATGHYCRIIKHNGVSYIGRGVDSLKDQSYYMWDLPQSTLNRIIFPLGEMTKRDVRNYLDTVPWATDFVSMQESMGVCFFEGQKFGQWLSQQGVEQQQGDVVSQDGVVVGRHNGVHLYTLAQKRGFVIYDDSSKGLSVVGIDNKNNRLVVGDSATLQSSKIIVANYNFQSLDEALSAHNIVVKVRGIGVNPTGYCTIERFTADKLKVTLLTDTAWAVTAGQPVIFYIEERLIGGGVAE